jgi:hypothetical protein
LGLNVSARHVLGGGKLLPYDGGGSWSGCRGGGRGGSGSGSRCGGLRGRGRRESLHEAETAGHLISIVVDSFNIETQYVCGDEGGDTASASNHDGASLTGTQGKADVVS